MTRKVYLEPPWVMHAGQQRLVAHPPAGYEFVVKETAQEKVFRTATRWNALRFILRSSDTILPTGLVKSWLERKNKPPAGTALTYSVDHLVFRSEPWVMEVEFASLVAGRDPKHLKRFKGIMERALASYHCRKVLCVSEAGRRTLLADLDSRSFQHKTEVVHYTVPPKSFAKEQSDKKVKLIFVGADALRSSEEAFEYKGGREVLETYAQLRSRFRCLELVVRSKVPSELKARYQGLEGLKIIEDYIPWEELEQEYLSADISILPSHTTIPATVLEAMSYELPVVTIDSWANAEYVEDGRTGLVGPRSTKLPYYYPGTSQVNFGTPQYNEAMRITDPKVVEGLAQRVGLLIEDPELRRQMGKAARWEVEHGMFSLAKINTQLGRIFDEAVAGDG
ncbi:MAG TPA: glycosyltransferase family 4 protein [Dehalococcoidia bacterium]|nr:glycosyltransferase family 4 protein [Dehalococcoidia bacterium]